MKKIVLVVLSLFMFVFVFSSSVHAKDKVKATTLMCSYITAGMDSHIKLRPLTFKDNGDVISDNKKIGDIVKADNNVIIATLGDDREFSLNKQNFLSVYSILIGGEPVYSYGSCYVNKE